MKHTIRVLWTFFLVLLIFSSLPFLVECWPTRGMGQGTPAAALTERNLLRPCQFLQGPMTRSNPWFDPQTVDITVKVWETPLVLEGTARSRSEVRPDGTYGVTFDLLRIVKGNAPILRRRKQFRLQFLDNPSPESNNSKPLMPQQAPVVNSRLKNLKRNAQPNLRSLDGQGNSALRSNNPRNLTRTPKVSQYNRNTNNVNENNGLKCLPPQATVKTGRKYFVFATKVFNHFIAAFSPELANKKNSKAIESTLCKGCGHAPSVGAAKEVVVKPKERLRMRCRLRAGNPIPALTWYKDGRHVNISDYRIRLRAKRRQSILVIRKAKESDAGSYKCEAKNLFGSSSATTKVSFLQVSPTSKSSTATASSSHPKPVETTPTTLWPLRSSDCPFDSYCLNGGTCSYYETIGEYVCQCAEGYKGQRCDTKDIPTSGSVYLSYFCIFGTTNPQYPC